MTESINNNTVSDEDWSKRRKKKRSKNNRREFFSTHEINEVNNKKAKTVNNNDNFTHQTAVNNKLVSNNKRPKGKKESNSKFEGIRADNNNLSTFYRRKNRKIHYSVVDIQQFNAFEDKPCTSKKRIAADRPKKEFNKNSKNKLCESANNKKNHQNNLQLSTEKFNERSEKSFLTRTINNNRLNNNSSNNDTKNNQFSRFKSENNTHKFPIHTKSYDTKTKNGRTTTYYIEIQKPGRVNEPTTIINDTVNIGSGDLGKRDNIWDFYSHNGQNTYSINNYSADNQAILNNATFAENRRKNEHTTIKNLEQPIAEPSRDDCGNPEPRIICSNKKCTDRETIRNNHRALLKYPVTNYCDSKCNNYFTDDENPEIKKQNDDNTCNNNKVSETCSTRDKNSFAQTNSNDPYYCKENNTLSSSSFDDQNEYEDNENDSHNVKYKSKCMRNNVYFTNENGNNWTAASLRYDHRKESITEIEENNYNDYDTQIDRGVVNFDCFVRHFVKIWEDVIQEISGGY